MTAAAIILAGGAQQIAASLPLTLAVAVACAVPAAALSWWLRRRNRITHLVFLPPLPEHATQSCPWCDDPECIDSSLCDCRARCGRGYCKAPLSAEELSRG